ncbi:MAG: hypothetical protein KDI01_12055, partial [Halioglobus sp.]|nr:hypothetical protein [Halioglobus sp.]
LTAEIKQIIRQITIPITETKQVTTLTAEIKQVITLTAEIKQIIRQITIPITETKQAITLIIETTQITKIILIMEAKQEKSAVAVPCVRLKTAIDASLLRPAGSVCKVMNSIIIPLNV